jgi:arylsulfatase A
VRTQRYRLVRETKGPGGGSKARANDDSAGAWQLYDMEADPGETTDLATREPETVARLAALYDAWFADISRERLGRLPLPVGHAEQNPVELHAPQASFDAPLHFASGPGFANDWLTGWEDPKAKVWFEIDVARAGDYAIEIAYSCPPEDAGSRLRITAGDAAVEVQVPAAAPVDIPLPHRDAEGHARYRSRAWATLGAGTLALPAGRTRLVLEPVAMPGGQVMDLKHVALRGPARE